MKEKTKEQQKKRRQAQCLSMADLYRRALEFGKEVKADRKIGWGDDLTHIM